MAIDADDLERRVMALLHLEQSNESMDRVDDHVIGMSATDMPQLIDALTRRVCSLTEKQQWALLGSCDPKNVRDPPLLLV